MSENDSFVPSWADGNIFGALPLLATAGAVCWQCAAMDEQQEDPSLETGLQRCTGCRRAVYCGPVCQKKDWKAAHRLICKRLKQVNAMPRTSGKLTWSDYQDLQKTRHKVLDDGDMSLSKTLIQRKALQFQPKCENCFRTPFDHPDGDYHPLKPCQDCKLAFFCSDPCRLAGLKEHQEKQCSLLQDLRICERILIKSIETEGHTVVQLPTMGPRRTYKPLSSVNTWYEYFKDLNGCEHIECVNSDFTPAESLLPNSKLVCEMLKLAADSASTVLTTLAALELIIPDLATRTRIVIHFVGGSTREMMLLRLNEELLHLLPKLQTLIVGYIGPDVSASSTAPGELLSSGCCPLCTSAGRKRQVFLRKQLYHECDDANLFPEFPPDLIVACNSGFSDEEPQLWGPTLRLILDKNIPALFTTFNEQEMRDERNIFGEMGAKFLQNVAENRWRGMVPKLENFGRRYEVFYFNYFRYIVKGRRT